MPLEFVYSDPLGVDTAAVASNIGTNVVRFGTVSLTQAAELGTPSVSQLEIDDPLGGFDFKGLRAFWVRETSAPSNNTYIWGGNVQDRTVYRADSMRTGTARRWRLDLTDANWSIGISVLVDSSANRPAETAGDRLRWLLASRHCRVNDYGNVTYGTTAMDACDYRGQRHGDVLADIALATGYNYWAERNEARPGRAELFMIDPNDPTSYPSSVRISNSLSDVDSSTVFAPYEDAVLTRSPQRIAYGVYMPYANGSVYVDSPTVGLQYALIDQSAPMANVKTRAKALARANRFLADHATEEDSITCSVMVPEAQVNDIRAGHAIQVKFTHLPGYESYTWMRVRQRTVVQDQAAADGRYRILLDMQDMGDQASTAIHAFGCPYILGDTSPGSYDASHSYYVGNTPSAKRQNVFLLGTVTSDASDYEAFHTSADLPRLTDGFCSGPAFWGGRGPSGCYVQVSTVQVTAESPLTTMAQAQSADTIIFWSGVNPATSKHVAGMSLTVDGVSVGSFSPTWSQQWNRAGGEAGSLAYLSGTIVDDTDLWGVRFDLGTLVTGTDWKMTLTIADPGVNNFMRLDEVQAFNFNH